MKEIEPDSDFSEQKYLNITKDDVMDESSSLKNINNIRNNENIEKPQKKADDNKKDNSYIDLFITYFFKSRNNR